MPLNIERRLQVDTSQEAQIRNLRGLRDSFKKTVDNPLSPAEAKAVAQAKIVEIDEKLAKLGETPASMEQLVQRADTAIAGELKQKEGQTEIARRAEVIDLASRRLQAADFGSLMRKPKLSSDVPNANQEQPPIAQAA